MEYQKQKPFEGIWKPHAVNKSSWMMKKMGKTLRESDDENELNASLQDI